MHFSEPDTEALARKYESDGFVKIQPLFDNAQMQQVEHELSHYIAEIVPTLPVGDVIFETERLADGKQVIRNLFRIEQHSTFFRELAYDPGLLALIGRLLHGEAEVLGVETFEKPAFVGSVVPFHQDNAYFNLVPPDSLTCWIALDDSTLENGCVHYVPGSHHQLRPHKPSGVKGNSLMMAEPPTAGEVEEVPGILSSGDAILHHCVLMHRSEPNRSARSRRSLLMVYRGKHCQTDAQGAQAYRAVLNTQDN